MFLLNEIVTCNVNIKCPLVCPCEFDGFISTFFVYKIPWNHLPSPKHIDVKSISIPFVADTGWPLLALEQEETHKPGDSEKVDKRPQT